MVLDTQPSADVTIALSSNDASEGTALPAALTFTGGVAGNWNVPQTVTVTGVDDALVDGNITYPVSVGDPASTGDSDYDGLSDGDTADVSVTNLDDDTAGVTVSSISGDTDESGTTATFTVVLTSQPSDDVTIPISSGDPSEGTVDQASLTFTGANWNTPQSVTVTGVDDALVDGDFTYTVEVGDPAGGDYDALTNADTADVSVTNLDDDSAGVTVSDDDKISQRLAVNYDWKGDGDFVVRGTWGTYVAGLANGVGAPAYWSALLLPLVQRILRVEEGVGAGRNGCEDRFVGGIDDFEGLVFFRISPLAVGVAAVLGDLVRRIVHGVWWGLEGPR